MSDLDYIASELRELAVPVESLRLDPQNARLHDEANHFHVRSMLAQFGQLVPIVAARKTGTVLKGNCTLEETRELGRTHIAVVWVDFEADDAVSFAVRDNRAGELGQWNGERLKEAIEQLNAAEQPRGALGWSPDELARILGQTPPGEMLATSFIDSLLTPAETRKLDAELEAETGIRATLAPEDDVRNARPIKVTPAQRETIDRAVEQMREETDDPSLSEGRALELALADWLAGV